MTSKARLFLYGLFLTGFIIKFFHIHYNAVLMLIAVGGLLILTFISLFRREKDNDAFAHFGIASWLLVLLFSVKFFPSSRIMLMNAAVLTLVAVVKSQFWKHRIPLLISASIAILVYLIPADQRYYLVNVKWNYEIDTDFITLDKYSWFLYKQGKVDEAEKISEQALNMAKKSEQPDWVKLIEEHSNRIKTGSWESYRESAPGRKASP